MSERIIYQGVPGRYKVERLNWTGEWDLVYRTHNVDYARRYADDLANDGFSSRVIDTDDVGEWPPPREDDGALEAQ